MNVQQITQEEFTSMSVDLVDDATTEMMNLGGLLIIKANNGKVLIQSALDSKYILITQD
jgi:hypothetical protein